MKLTLKCLIFKSLKGYKFGFDPTLLIIQGLKLFQYYSQSACVFENKIKQAKKICNCLPWYIPSNSKFRYEICDLYGNFCFKKVMKWFVNVDECLPSCHQLRYIFKSILSFSFQLIRFLYSQIYCWSIYWKIKAGSCL